LYTALVTDIFNRHGPSQADVATFKAFKSPPAVEKYPHAYRWYKHIDSYQSEFSSLPGDPSKAYTTYGPENVAAEANPKNAPAAEEDDEMDLFGSDSEEEDPDVVAEREQRLADYKKKKEGKAKPAAKSIVTLDVKPWGRLVLFHGRCTRLTVLYQTMKPT